MVSGFRQRLALIEQSDRRSLAGGRKGIEKEALRISPDGLMAMTPHPIALGSALTNRYITTDYSEALLEFVTPAYARSWEALQVLCDIHQFTHDNLGDELLWPASMPCGVPDGAEIPLARYGSSNVGEMKTIYRRGLGHRYGRPMQTIAGVHFNYSVPTSFWPMYRELLDDPRSEDAFRSDHYLRLVRNCRRFGWLILYLFGASPALCRSFGSVSELDMPMLRQDTLYQPYATSLRMSDLGYSNKTQAGIRLSLNDLDEYITALSNAIKTPEPRYEAIGVKVDGEYQQLSTSTLQIENEYYSSIRPKRVAKSGERPTAALHRGGIEYVEIRSLDVNLFDPAGINQNTMRFVEAFLLYCLLEDSPPFDDDDLARSNRNHSRVARTGREPGLGLERSTGLVDLRDWALSIVDHAAEIAELIDAGEGGSDYAAATAVMRERVQHPEKTPSAILLDELQTGSAGYSEFVFGVAESHRDYFHALKPMPPRRRAEFEREARDSIERQKRIEASDSLSLDDYLAAWFSDAAEDGHAESA
jgi:glutamate--cysteine ligase